VIAALRIGTAAVWLIFGVVFKMLGLVPRHRLIVASVVGDAAAGPVTVLVGAAEAAMGLWILSGVRPRACATVQTLAIAAMNALELSLARDLLLAPIPMVYANAAFLGIVWYCALKAAPQPQVG
jgi:uncharacterized membrane protein YphA (DoxX/SURF4 family)